MLIAENKQLVEANKINGEAQGLRLDNGVELTYCELGEEKSPNPLATSVPPFCNAP